MSPGEPSERNDTGQCFATTHWSVVVTAGHGSSPDAGAALETLCRGYWAPLYAFIRRQGHSPSDAQDLTQEFLLDLLEGQQLRATDPERGKFRSFLLTRLKHFLLDERKKANAQKRGGKRIFVSIDETSTESRLQIELVNPQTPDQCFEKQWGLTVLERALDRLRQDYGARGKAERFAKLRTCLVGGADQPASYAQLAQQLGLSEGAVKLAVFRLRREFGGLLRAEVAQTVSDPGEIEDEMRYLLAVTST